MAAPAQYDDFAGLYTDSTLSSLHNAYIERPAMIELIGDVKGLQILDLGCGTMILGVQLLEAGATYVCGIDASAKMLHIAESRIPVEKKVRTALLEHDLNKPFRFADGKQYDLVTSSLALHYLETWQPVLASAYSHLKPGGRFILSCHHPFADWMNHPEVQSYFAGPTLIHEDWKAKDGAKISLDFYRRPLTMMCKDFAEAGWMIERIVEPAPTEASKGLFESERWERVASKPNFIIFVLKKPI